MDIEQFRKDLTITLFGSHQALQRLERLKRSFISSGYTNTSMVKDYREIAGIDLSAFTDNEECNSVMRLSDMNLFVFFIETDNQGPAAEFIYMLDTDPILLKNTIVLVEMPDRIDYSEPSDVVISSYIRSHRNYKNVKIVRVNRDNDTDLFRRAVQMVWATRIGTLIF